MMCRHEKNQQAPCLEVVGPYGRYCLIRQLVVTRRQLRKARYLRSDIFTLCSSFCERFSTRTVAQAGQQGLRVWRHVDEMPRREAFPTKRCMIRKSQPCRYGVVFRAFKVHHVTHCILFTWEVSKNPGVRAFLSHTLDRYAPP